MKKFVIFSALPVLLVGMFAIMVFAALGGGEAAKPIATPTTVEHATEYYACANELGVPWDLVMLIDTMISDQAGYNMPDTNPLKTSLNFSYIVVYWERYYSDPEEGSGGEWRPSGEDTYNGSAEIYSLLGLSDTSIVTDISVKMREYDEENKTSTRRSKSYIYSVEPEEYRGIIENYYSDIFEDSLIDDIMTLYESQYLYYLYFDEIMNHELSDFSDYDLPEITIGDVTREELIQVAISLVNRPYLFGGKSPYPGAPRSLLDCSGYIDWVFVQCFNQTVSSNWGGVAVQFYNCQPITESELKPGDLGFYWHPENVPANEPYNHIGIYVGEIDGKPAFAHCGGPYWGYPGSDSGRVVVSINDRITVNSKSPLGGEFDCLPMNPSNFTLFGRPQFLFAGESIEDEEDYEDQN